MHNRISLSYLAMCELAISMDVSNSLRWALELKKKQTKKMTEKDDGKTYNKLAAVAAAHFFSILFRSFAF